MKNISLFLLLIFLGNTSFAQQIDKKAEINTFIDAWHKAAADTNAKVYFGSIADDGIYLGTDASERWLKKDFQIWSKPYFDSGKAWSFTKISREIYFDKKGEMAWFEENLNTQMGVCRGSGVLIMTKQGWKIKHYVLSVTIANELIDDFKELEKLLPEKKVIAVLKKLIKAIKTKDVAMAESVFTKNARLTSMSIKEGKAVMETKNIGNISEFIGAASEDIYEERISDYQVRIDGIMATVWTPYEFYLNDEFHHGGVNAFQLFRGEEGWKIVSISDTRRKK